MIKKEAGISLLMSNFDVLVHDFYNHPDHDGVRDYAH
jgi:hypothetical protein